MDGLYGRRRERFRLGYLKERGGLCRVVQMVVLGSVLGFLGMSPGSDKVTFHAVMTTVVLATVTVAFMAHLLRHQRRFCFSARSWAIVETVHDVVGAGLLLPGALMLLVPPLNSSLTVAAVLTLLGLVVLGVQAVENFQRARGHAVPSRLATPVPIMPVHTRLMTSSRPPDALVSVPPVSQTTADTKQSSPSSLSSRAPPSRRKMTMMSNVTPFEKNQSDSGIFESNFGNGMSLPRSYSSEVTPTPAALGGTVSPATQWSRPPETATKLSNPTTVLSWSTLSNARPSPSRNVVATAPGEITDTSLLIAPQQLTSAATTSILSVSQQTPSTVTLSDCLAPQKNLSSSSCLMVPQRTPAAKGASSPIVFLTPYETPSAVFSSSYHTPAGPLPPTLPTTQPNPSPAGSVFSAASASPAQGSCRGIDAPGWVATPGGEGVLLPPPPAVPERDVRLVASRHSQGGTVDPPTPAMTPGLSPP